MTAIPVMIVDDNEADRYLLKRDLKKSGLDHVVFESSDGDEALRFLEAFEEHKSTYGEHFPPRVIFLDINMPRVGGFEFLEMFATLRESNPAYRDCAIMMFSSSELHNERLRAGAQGFVFRFLTKGQTTPEELHKLINDAVSAQLEPA